ncbi:hypothetical protein [Nonomuraea rhodomycinica]|uniref:Uncharacterized protein n=1 Tax=Nonomuraea rhodomycinica TaxID=1712872 RepID=A0A7Y6IV39_9ACTN|nr:hypothetical protein [Nonomuraea rhodomycinica]NUW44830.1 hypothetical protein [Nonomuraea rhodomycinica]
MVMQVGLRHFPPLLYAGLRFALAGLPALLFVGRPQVAWRWVAGVAAAIGVGTPALPLVTPRRARTGGFHGLRELHGAAQLAPLTSRARRHALRARSHASLVLKWVS